MKGLTNPTFYLHSSLAVLFFIGLLSNFPSVVTALTWVKKEYITWCESKSLGRKQGVCDYNRSPLADLGRVCPFMVRNFLNFMQFFGIFGKILAPLLRGILDPPLISNQCWDVKYKVRSEALTTYTLQITLTMNVYSVSGRSLSAVWCRSVPEYITSPFINKSYRLSFPCGTSGDLQETYISPRPRTNTSGFEGLCVPEMANLKW